MGASKLPTVITALLPQCVVVTEAKSPDLHVANSLHFEAGDLLIFDRGYLDYAWMPRLQRRRISCVTRLKTNARLEVVAVKRDSNDHRVIAHEIIRLSSTPGQESYPDLRRRVVYQDPESGKQYVFLSNGHDLAVTREP
jgi:hypothetical protein